MTSPNQISNFGFLAEHDPLFVELALSAERAFASDPNTTLIKLRQLGEAIAQHIAALVGISFDEQTTQADLLYKINRKLKLEPVVRELLHTLRVEGNKATHQFRTQHKEAMSGLVVARKLAIWFHQSFGKEGTHSKPGPFAPPAGPSEPLRKLQSEIQNGITFAKGDTVSAINTQTGEVQSAVRNQTNQDIAASIIGHIRRAAFGEPLVPFEQRVAQAMQRIYQSYNWLPTQCKWLERLAKQLVHEVIIDRDFVNNRFAEQGGAKQLDKVFGNQSDTVLDELSDAIWSPKSA